MLLNTPTIEGKNVAKAIESSVAEGTWTKVVAAVPNKKPKNSLSWRLETGESESEMIAAM